MNFSNLKNAIFLAFRLALKTSKHLTPQQHQACTTVRSPCDVSSSLASESGELEPPPGAFRLACQAHGFAIMTGSVEFLGGIGTALLPESDVRTNIMNELQSTTSEQIYSRLLSQLYNLLFHAKDCVSPSKASTLLIQKVTHRKSAFAP